MLALRATNFGSFRRTCNVIRQHIHSNSKQAVSPSRFSSGLIGGLAGGSLVFLAGYGFYHFSGVRQIVTTASGAQKKLKSYAESFKDKAPPPNEAVEWLRKTANYYAYFIPGGRDYVDSIFQIIESIQQKHSEEFDEIIKQTYEDLREVSKYGPSTDAASKGWHVLQIFSKKITQLLGVSINDALDNHPHGKEKLSEKFHQLKSLAESHGPEAKKELIRVYQEAASAIKEGLTSESIGKIGKAIDRAMERISKLAK